MNADEDEVLLLTKTFAELGLSAKVLAAIEVAGYTTPTPIQSEAIPVAATGRDVLGIAQTGTGKTASFVLPMITRLEAGRARARMPRTLALGHHLRDAPLLVDHVVAGDLALRQRQPGDGLLAAGDARVVQEKDCGDA